MSPQLLVLSEVDRVLDEVDWLIARRKTHTAPDKSGSGETPPRADASVGLMEGAGDRCISVRLTY